VEAQVPGKIMENIRSEFMKEDHKEFKKALIDVFQQFGYVKKDGDYEVKIKITSGNIAWININSIEIIK
jgi:hypothetical protein